MHGSTSSIHRLIGAAAVVLLLVPATICLAAGEVVCWGDNGQGQCDVPAPNEDFIAITGGYEYSIGLRSSGVLAAWGANDRGQCELPDPNTDFVSVSAKGHHTMALRTDGSLAIWGFNENGQCDLPYPNEGYIAAVAGGYHSLALRPGGVVEAWGRSGSGQCDVPLPNEGFVTVAAGYYHSLALRSDGTIAAWGSNTYGQCDVPSPNAGFVAVAAGGYFSMGRKADGSIVAWGGNTYGQCDVMPPNADFLEMDGGAYHAVGLRGDHSSAAWGMDANGQSGAPYPNEDLGTVAAGGLHSLAVRGPVFRCTLTDVPDDQGGYLRAGWPRHRAEDESAPEAVTGYDVQRLEDGWVTLVTVVADGSADYETVIETPDIVSIDGPAPVSAYRVVARTADPATSFVSGTVIGSSIDNLAPPQPLVSLVEYGDVAVITWIMPDIPDFVEACVYRGSTADFVPEVPIQCTDVSGISDEFSVLVYYRVQFADTHGNLSEFSEVIYPTSTGVGGAAPAALALHPCFPNPFNPQTTVSFVVPGDGPVTAAIYDAAGHQVAVLVDEDLPAGPHRYVWNGRAEDGGPAPSGTYVCRLVTTWGTQARKMQLLK